MTARQIWEGMLTELSKVNAPSMLLQDFNYFFNKAINQYINKRYNIYDINLQTTDDLRVLKATSVLDVSKATNKTPMKDLVGLGAGSSKLFGATYEVNLPDDYLHILNCVCIYKVNKNWKCYNAGDYVQFSAKRLTADSWSVILNDYYNRPLPERPYFYIHNVNTSIEEPTNIYDELSKTGTDQINNVKSYSDNPYPNPVEINNIKINPNSNNRYDFNEILFLKVKLATNTHHIELTSNFKDYELNPSDRFGTNGETAGFEIYKKSTNQGVAFCYSNSGVYHLTTFDPAEEGERNDMLIKVCELNNTFPRSISIKNTVVNLVDKPEYIRHSNSSKVRMEIRYGHDDTVFLLEKVFVDYIKSPQHIRLTQEQVNLTEDTSLIMEFPDYVCQEIINELTNIVMENIADPRLLTHPVVTQSIAPPAQQLTQPQQPRASQTKRG